MLTSVTDAEGYTTTYDYDKNTDQLIRVKKNADGKDYVLQYTYEQDKIKTITRNGVTYGYAYDAYGNQTGVTLNGKILKEVTYRNKKRAGRPADFLQQEKRSAMSTMRKNA